MSAPEPSADPAAVPEASAVRGRAQTLERIAEAADRAAARLEARDLLAPTADARTGTGPALRRIGAAHRAAASALSAHAGELERATHRRAALDDLVRVARRSSPSLAGARAARQIELMRDELVGELDTTLAASSAACADALAAVTPDRERADACTAALIAGLTETSERIGALAGNGTGAARAVVGDAPLA